jgi:hypothetical protein
MNLRRRLCRVAVSLAALGIAATAMAGNAVAFASGSEVTSATPSSEAVLVQAPMTLDCTNLSASARRYAVAHGYCPSSASGTATPYDTVTGNCGSSWIYIYPWGYAGEANVNYGFSSSKGTVVHRALYGYWDSTNGLSGSWTDIAWMASSRYSHTRTINSGRGWMYATLSGFVTLWWEGQCYLLNPWDERYVT